MRCVTSVQWIEHDDLEEISRCSSRLQASNTQTLPELSHRLPPAPKYPKLWLYRSLQDPSDSSRNELSHKNCTIYPVIVMKYTLKFTLLNPQRLAIYRTVRNMFTPTKFAARVYFPIFITAFRNQTL